MSARPRSLEYMLAAAALGSVVGLAQPAGMTPIPALLRYRPMPAKKKASPEQLARKAKRKAQRAARKITRSKS